MNTFKAFDPGTIYAKSYSTACEACYSRKVKCEPNGNATGCKQCADHSVACIPRTRKRKPQTADEGQDDLGNGNIAANSVKAQRNGNAGAGASREPTRRRSTTDARRPGQAAKRTNSVSVPGLFISSDPTNEYSPESAAQSETPSQTRNASYLSRSAILGDDFPDIDHAHGIDRTVSERKLPSPTTMKVLTLYEAFDLPPLPLRQSLIEAFYERCYTWMPVIDIDLFNGDPASGEISLLLLQSVILAGSLLRPQVCETGFAERQYQRVKALIHSGYERDPLMMLAGLCIVQNYAPHVPTDISADMPRAWNIYAVSLAHQLGLHRTPRIERSHQGLRNRIWWTLVWRDNLSASCHGRPRIIHMEDCNAPTPRPEDFPYPHDTRAELFCRYIAVIGIMGDLCSVITRKGQIDREDRYTLATRLLNFITALPESLQLYSPNGVARQYDFDLAQLHVPILITLAILFRPRTVHQLAGSNAASVTAAFLLFRIFEAIQLREHTRYLSSGYGWYFLVTAMPLLSCTKVAALREEADQALKSLEEALETLGQFKPAAANNLRNIRAIRKAMNAKSRAPTSTPHTVEQDIESIQLGRQILEVYGIGAVHQCEQIEGILSAHKSSQVDRSAQAAAHTLSCLSGRQDALPMNGRLTPEAEAYLPTTGFDDELQNVFTAVFEDETLMGANNWMMRDWMDEWPL